MPVKILFETIPGLTEISKSEIKSAFGKTADFYRTDLDGVYSRYNGAFKELLKLRTVPNIYLIEEFSIVRPNGLMSPENISRIIDSLKQVARQNPELTSFRIHAAGHTSKIFQRIIQAIANTAGLKHNEHQGDIKIRVFPLKSKNIDAGNSSKSAKFGRDTGSQSSTWIVAIRIHQKSLAVRDWKVSDMRGALNPCIAAAIIRLLQPQKNTRLLNVMCGSGTLIAETLLNNPNVQCAGIDNNQNALTHAAHNLTYFRSSTELHKCPAEKLPFENNTFTTITTDLPWGEVISTSTDLPVLYNRTFSEISRVAGKTAKLALLTQRSAIVESELQKSLSSWKLNEKIKIFQKGFNPTLFLFSR